MFAFNQNRILLRDVKRPLRPDETLFGQMVVPQRVGTVKEGLDFPFVRNSRYAFTWPRRFV